MTAPDTDALRGLVERAHERVGGVSIDRMGGDNLAVTLCSHFDDGEGDNDETGWSEAATAGYHETVEAIRTHYQPVFDALLGHIATHDADRAADKARIARYTEALRNIQYEAERPDGRIVHLKRAIAVAARSVLGDAG